MDVNKSICEILGVPLDFENEKNYLILQEFLFSEYGGFDEIRQCNKETFKEAFLMYFLKALLFIRDEGGTEALNNFRKRFVKVKWE